MDKSKNMYRDITNDNQEIYKITEPGEYVFYFENKSGNIIFDTTCENADLKIYGLYQCNNLDELTLNITQKHSTPNSTSNVLIKSILRDKSTFNFTGTINIKREAINSIAHLTNSNLLLSESAHVITNPQLEVIPGEVECTHAATTSPLNQKQLNYLQAKGLSENNAKQLLIDGFINEILKLKK